MGKTGYITARVEPKLKARAGRVLAKAGVSTTEAITMFLTQIVLNDGPPFDMRVPNAQTRKAIEELENPVKRAKLKRYATLAAFREEVENRDVSPLVEDNRSQPSRRALPPSRNPISERPCDPFGSGCREPNP
jgi:DNA-damage-inducible protein J